MNKRPEILQRDNMNEEDPKIEQKKQAPTTNLDLVENIYKSYGKVRAVNRAELDC